MDENDEREIKSTHADVIGLMVAAADDRDAGVVMHQHPALNSLADLCGILAYYRFMLQDPRTPAELEEFADRAIRGALPLDADPVVRSTAVRQVASLDYERRRLRACE